MKKQHTVFLGPLLNNSSSPTIQPPFPHPTQQFFSDHQLDLSCCTCYGTYLFHKGTFFWRGSIGSKKHNLFYKCLSAQFNPSDIPFLTKDLFIGCAWETTPFSQKLRFPFFKGPYPSIGQNSETPFQTFFSKDLILLFMSLSWWIELFWRLPLKVPWKVPYIGQLDQLLHVILGSFIGFGHFYQQLLQSWQAQALLCTNIL